MQDKKERDGEDALFRVERVIGAFPVYYYLARVSLLVSASASTYIRTIIIIRILIPAPASLLILISLSRTLTTPPLPLFRAYLEVSLRH